MIALLKTGTNATFHRLGIYKYKIDDVLEKPANYMCWVLGRINDGYDLLCEHKGLKTIIHADDILNWDFFEDSIPYIPYHILEDLYDFSFTDSYFSTFSLPEFIETNYFY